jgi:hypothetical protein
MKKNSSKMLFLTIIMVNLMLSAKVAGQTISSFSPGSIVAGINSVITINGTGFGTSGPDSTTYVQFSGASTLEGAPNPKGLEYVSWADTKILVQVPSDAGTGVIKVVIANKIITSAASLTVSYDIEDAVSNNISYPLSLVNRNTYGGYTFHFSPNFNSNVIATQAFTRAFKTWKCATSVNWVIGNPTAIGVVAYDGVNTVTFDSDSDKLDAGTLGEAVYYYESAATGRWEMAETDIIFASSTEYNWNFSSNAPTTNQYDFETVSLHELGHTHGLGHVNNTADVMNAVTYNGTTKRTLNTNNISAGMYIMSESTPKATLFIYPAMIPISSGSCDNPPPIINSFTPAAGGLGTAVKIKGVSFTGTLAVSFGSTAASSFSVVSDTVITAVVSTGSTGAISITAPQGFATINGFTYIPTPLILAGGPVAFFTGGSVILTASTGKGYDYIWTKDGVDITGATGVSYTATTSGSYTVSIISGSTRVTSATITVSSVFTLPSSNFKLTINGATCDGSNNGFINITAAQSLSYTATITGNGLNKSYTFTDTTTINNLAAGSYNVCMTVAGQSDYENCYDLVISQPQPLSVYATVDNVKRSITLAFTGGNTYNIQLNGKQYTTTDSSISLPLQTGTNRLLVTTDKECQGTFEKLINPSSLVIPYPNPFQNTLNINLGETNIAHVKVSIYDGQTGKLVFTNQYENQSGVLQLGLDGFVNGVYALHLILNNSDNIFKIVK